MALENQLAHMRAEYQTTCESLQGESQAERTIRELMCEAKRRELELITLESQLLMTQDW